MIEQFAIKNYRQAAQPPYHIIIIIMIRSKFSKGQKTANFDKRPLYNYSLMIICLSGGHKFTKKTKRCVSSLLHVVQSGVLVTAIGHQ